MGQINTTNLPQYVSDTQLAATKTKTRNKAAGSAELSDGRTTQDALQFTKLSGVLNGFRNGTSNVRSQVAMVMTSVRGGTYEVDPMQVSRSIVGESLAAH